MKKNRILITGASGYIGSHIMPILVEKNYEIYAISRYIKKDYFKKNVIWYDVDLLNEKEVENLFHIIIFEIMSVILV